MKVSYTKPVTWAGFDLMATLAALPVDLVNAFVETGTEFNQIISGGFSLQRRPDGALTGRGELAATPGRTVSVDDPEMFFDTGPARFGFDIYDDDLRLVRVVDGIIY